MKGANVAVQERMSYNGRWKGETYSRYKQLQNIIHGLIVSFTLGSKP